MNQSSLTVWDRIIPNSLSPILSPYDSWPVAALAGVHVDQAGLAALQVGVSVEALEKRVPISYILIQAIGATAAKVCHGVPGGGGCRGGGGLWSKTCTVRH